MSLRSDLKTLYALTLAPVRGQHHADRLESFYGRQARAYDAFRDRLLPGRSELVHSLPMPVDGVWIDVGAGTGRNLEYAGSALSRVRHVVLVDLCPSLLAVAADRVRARGWRPVSLLRADAAQPVFARGSADLVTFSFALTMIPDWFAAIDLAHETLRPGGTIGVVDFYVSRRHPDGATVRHGWLARHGWPAWFDRDNVRPHADHVHYLRHRFTTSTFSEHTSRVPYLPGVRVPYYQFIGRRAD